jgi:hypothetical protein
MEIKQVTIELNEETIRKLEEKALKAGKKPESLAADLVATSLSKDTPVDTSDMPEVALLKSDFSPTVVDSDSTDTDSGLIKNSAEPLFESTAPELPNERMQRKTEIEAKMRELALVIETAAEADKEKYAMQYAILAAELNALL